MRLIDADALLNLPFEKMIHTDYGDTCVPIEEIEAAPTVEPFERIGAICNENCGYKPQGDLISREDLRKQIDDCKFFDNSFQKMTVAEFLTIIHNIINKEAEDGES